VSNVQIRSETETESASDVPVLVMHGIEFIGAEVT
jgi:hypothetical protein